MNWTRVRHETQIDKIRRESDCFDPNWVWIKRDATNTTKLAKKRRGRLKGRARRQQEIQALRSKPHLNDNQKRRLRSLLAQERNASKSGKVTRIVYNKAKPKPKPKPKPKSKPRSDPKPDYLKLYYENKANKDKQAVINLALQIMLNDDTLTKEQAMERAYDLWFNADPPWDG